MAKRKSREEIKIEDLLGSAREDRCVISSRSIDSGRNEITIEWNGIVVMPYVRQTRRMRFRRDKAGERANEYNEQRATLRDELFVALYNAGLHVPDGCVFDKKRLKFSGLFYVESDLIGDLDNLIKASWDVCNEILWTDDRYVVRLGESSKLKGVPYMKWVISEVYV